MNGRFSDPSSCAIPTTDFSLQRGVGVFDTARTYDRRPFALAEHIDRFFESARLLRIRTCIPKDEVASVIREGIRLRGDETLVKMFFTGGDVEEAGCFPAPRFYVHFLPLTKWSEEQYLAGISLDPIPVARPLPRAKTIDYVTPMTMKDPSSRAFETLYCPDGRITESATSSVFFVFGEHLVTAPDDIVLPGVTRRIMIDLAVATGIPVEYRTVALEDVVRADEAFITGSVKEILPIHHVGDRAVAGRHPGPVTRKLRDLFFRNRERLLEQDRSL
jgi:branched-chain amino acid aminotransferase